MSTSVFVASEFVLSPSLEARWLACLPPARRADISRWSDAGARRRSLIGSRLLAEGLRRLGHGADALASLRYPSQCRPTLDLPLDFSLSHCDGRIVCAVSTQGAIGIDVEALAGLRAPGFRLYLTAAERAWAGRSSRRFYSVWTRKEAVAKAAGSRGLRDVARVATRPAGHGADLNERRWQTRAVPVGRDHVAHLAAAEAPRSLTVERLTRRTLEPECDAQPTTRDATVACACAVL